MTRDGNGAHAGSGANLSFDGRWRVTVAVERGASSVEVPLDIEVRGRTYPVVVARIPGRPVWYTVDVLGAASLRFSPEPERAGPSRLYVTCYDFIGDERRVAYMVVTIAAGGTPARQLPLKRLSAGRFVADVDFAPGRHTFSAVAQTVEGTRVRATVQIDIPPR